MNILTIERLNRMVSFLVVLALFFTLTTSFTFAEGEEVVSEDATVSALDVQEGEEQVVDETLPPVEEGGFFFAAKKVEVNDEVLVDEVTVIEQDNSLIPKCEEENPMEWHWVITGIDDADDAPEEITVYFSSGEETVGLEKVTGKTAHYRWNGNLGDTLEEPGATAVYDGDYINFNLSHGPCVVPLEVTKTAVTSYDREWTWDIEKTADQDDLGLLEDGEIETVNYTITVEGESEDVDHLVSGVITITNPESNPVAIIASVEDVMDSEDVDVDCGVSFPYDLESGDTLECTYSTDENEGEDTINTVTVTTAGLVPGDSAEADVVWGEPANVIDECIVVDDTNAQGPQDQEVCGVDLVDGAYTFEYAVTFSKDQATNVVWACGQEEYENTASFQTVDDENDTTQNGSDTVTIDGSVICFCSFSQGYWFAKKNNTWPVASIEIGGKSYTQADGLKIWNSSNKNGITDAKKGFLQAAAIILSAEDQDLPIPAELQGYINTINAFLTGKAKVTGNNITVKSASVSAAAGAISNWIEENHCQ